MTKGNLFAWHGSNSKFVYLLISISISSFLFLTSHNASWWFYWKENFPSSWTACHDVFMVFYEVYINIWRKVSKWLGFMALFERMWFALPSSFWNKKFMILIFTWTYVDVCIHDWKTEKRITSRLICKNATWQTTSSRLSWVEVSWADMMKNVTTQLWYCSRLHTA